MRDDIHKHVPAPPKFQFWVRRALRPADQARAYDALVDAIVDVGRREISKRFLESIQLHLVAGDRDLFRPFSSIRDARDVGGKGTPLEQSILSECQRLLADGIDRTVILKPSVQQAIQNQVDAYLRSADAVLRGADDPRARDGIRQLVADRNRLNLNDVCSAILDRDVSRSVTRSKPQLSPEENLLSREK